MACNHCSDSCKLCTSDIVLFSNLPLEEQQNLQEISRHRTFTRGDILFYAGDKADVLRIVHGGKVKLHNHDLEGKEQIYDIIGDGDSIGEDLFLENNAVYPYDATCITDGRMCEISKDIFMDLLRAKPEVAMNLIGSLSRKLQQANERMDVLSENDAGMRLATFFYNRCKRQNHYIVDLTVDDIAASINLRRETVSRKIRELQQLGIVKRMGQSNIRISDMNRLRLYAEGEMEALITK